MSKLKPEYRVIVGRNITLVAGGIYALTRCLYYANLDPHAMSPAQGTITVGGQLLWAWAAVWGIAAVACIADMVNRHTRHGLSLVVGLAFAWGFAYAIMWAATGCTDPMLLSSAVGWVTPAALVFGFLLKVTALQDMLRTRDKEAQ
ncbi:membrane protein [Arthrobacter phage Gusanita]|nr:membrane protein [Arthrobacter phage Gusanita]